jgi:hypothetical protein
MGEGKTHPPRRMADLEVFTFLTCPHKRERNKRGERGFKLITFTTLLGVIQPIELLIEDTDPKV